MTGLLPLLTTVAAVIFVTTSMVSAGLVVRPLELVPPLRQGRVIGAAIIANFIGAPIIAWAIGRLLRLQPDHATGLLLLGFAAGAPFLPKLAAIARARVPVAVTLMFVLVIGTVAILPVAASRIASGAAAPAWDIARPLLLLVALPLGAGLLVRARWERAGARAEPVLRRASDAALVAFVALVIASHAGALWAVVGTGAILAAALFVFLCGAFAHLIGGPDAGVRRVIVLSAAQRNVAAALVTAGAALSDRPGVIVMVLVTDVVAIVLLLIAARRFRQTPADTTPPDPRAAPTEPR